MDRILKAVIFDKNARVTFIDSTELIRKMVEIHDLSPLAAACLGRSLTMGAYVSTNLKDEKSSFRIVIEGDGPIGKINIAGYGGNNVVGYVDNPHVDLPLREDGKLNVGGAVGKGAITVVKDYGLKKPYVGRCELVSGELAEDFAEYLLKSEGIKSTVCFGVRMDANGVLASGGVIVEALPGITEEQLFMLEDIMTNFTAISKMIEEKPIEELMAFYFGHLNCEFLDAEKLNFKCICNQKKMDDLVRQIGLKECRSIIADIGFLVISCQYCRSKYEYDLPMVEELCK